MSGNNYITAKYLLIIDTDQYAGNFERQLTGFCTGVHDGTHGDLEASMFDEFIEANDIESNWESLVTTSVTDENGYQRVCSIWPSPGRFNNGMGHCYDANDPVAMGEARALSKQAMKEYHASQIAMCERRLAEGDFEEDRRGGWTKEACERTIASALLSIEQAGTFVENPAYESVVIFLQREPTAEDMALFRRRLADYAEDMFVFGRRTGERLRVDRVYMLNRTITVTDMEVPLLG